MRGRRLWRRLLCLLLAVLCLAGGAAALEPAYRVTEAYAAGPFCQELLDLELSGNARADLVNVALSQLGYHEGDCFAERSGLNGDGNGNFTEFGYFCRCDSFAWCAMFVTWCARQAGIPEAALAYSRVADPSVFGTDLRAPDSGAPAPGDLVYFRGSTQTWAHVGIVVRVEAERFFTVEGNANDMVRLRSYAFDDESIVGFGSFTDEPCDETLLRMGRLYELHCEPNGGCGTRRDQVAMEGAPLQLYKNSAPDEDEADDADWFRCEGCSFGGWLVRREADGRWLGEDGWLLPEEVSAERPRRVLPDKAALTPDESWSGEDLAAFTLFALWLDGETGLPAEAESYIPRPDATGWVNPYGDLREGAPGYDAARALLQEGVVQGRDGQFRGGEALTAAELAEALQRLEAAPEEAVDAAAAEDDASLTETVLLGEPPAAESSALSWALEEGLLPRAAAEGTPLSLPELLECLHRWARRRGLAAPAEGTRRLLMSANAARTEAFLWAAESGLLDAAGLGGGRLLGGATRMELCRLLAALTAETAEKEGET